MSEEVQPNKKHARPDFGVARPQHWFRLDSTWNREIRRRGATSSPSGLAVVGEACALYLDTESNDAIIGFEVALLEVLREVDIEIVGFEEAERGSWFRRFIARVTGKQARELARRLKRAAEIAIVDQPQAVANSSHASAVHQLAEASRDIPNFAAMVGTVLFLKVTDINGPAVTVVTLSLTERAELESRRELFTNPKKLAEYIDDARRDRPDDDERRLGSP